MKEKKKLKKIVLKGYRILNKSYIFVLIYNPLTVSSDSSIFSSSKCLRSKHFNENTSKIKTFI